MNQTPPSVTAPTEYTDMSSIKNPKFNWEEHAVGEKILVVTVEEIHRTDK